jgi:hypothetical protein
MRLSVIIFPLTALAYTCNQEGSSGTQKMETPSVEIVTSRDTVITGIDFSVEIMPIFKARCSPCHFPGGKMYSKLPFDSAKTITSHPEGILRRIKDPAESKKIKDFIDQSGKH